MVLGHAIFGYLIERELTRSEGRRLAKFLKMAESECHRLWVNGREVPYPFTTYKAIVLIVFLIQELDRRCVLENPSSPDDCVKIGTDGKERTVMWADILTTLDDRVRQEGFSRNPDATFERLAIAVSCLFWWNGFYDNPGMRRGPNNEIQWFVTRAEDGICQFINTVSLGLDEYTPPPSVGEPQPVNETPGEGSGEPQPVNETPGEGSGEPQPVNETPGEGSGEPQPVASVPTNTERVRGATRYRLRETYQRERARRAMVRHRYNLRDTPAREEDLSTREEDRKRERAEGSARSRKRSGRR